MPAYTARVKLTGCLLDLYVDYSISFEHHAIIRIIFEKLFSSIILQYHWSPYGKPVLPIQIFTDMVFDIFDYIAEIIDVFTGIRTELSIKYYIIEFSIKYYIEQVDYCAV